MQVHVVHLPQPESEPMQFMINKYFKTPKYAIILLSVDVGSITFNSNQFGQLGKGLPFLCDKDGDAADCIQMNFL